MKKIFFLLGFILLLIPVKSQVIRASAAYNKVQVVGDSYGPELIDDPGFDDTGSWYEFGTWAVAGGDATAGPETGYDSNLNYWDTGILFNGVTYRIEYEVVSFDGAGDIYVAVPGQNGTNRNSAGVYVEELTPNADDGYLIFNILPNITSCVIDNVSVKEVL